MNSVANPSFTGDGLQVHLVQVIFPWFIRKETDSVELILMENNSCTQVNSFIEYYY